MTMRCNVPVDLVSAPSTSVLLLGGGRKFRQIPAKSPDLNPIEKCWSWLRRRLRDIDFEDLRAKRAVPGKMAYRRRVVNVLKSTKAQQMASNCFNGSTRFARKFPTSVEKLPVARCLCVSRLLSPHVVGGAAVALFCLTFFCASVVFAPACGCGRGAGNAMFLDTSFCSPWCWA